MTYTRRYTIKYKKKCETLKVLINTKKLGKELIKYWNKKAKGIWIYKFLSIEVQSFNIPKNEVNIIRVALDKRIIIGE